MSDTGSATDRAMWMLHDAVKEIDGARVWIDPADAEHRRGHDERLIAVDAPNGERLATGQAASMFDAVVDAIAQLEGRDLPEVLARLSEDQ